MSSSSDRPSDRPTPELGSRWLDFVRVFVLTSGGLGLSGWAPGTFGTIGGVLLAIALEFVPGLPFSVVLALGAFVCTVVGVLLGPWAERYFGKKDPGAIVLDETQTRAALAAQESAGELPDGTTADAAFAEGGFRAYVDLEDAAFADHKRALALLLTAAYQEEGVEATRAAELAARYAQGNTDAGLLQSLIAEGRASLPSDLMGIADIDPTDPTLPLGLPYFGLGKTGLVGQLGARYLTV
ncbi:MAG: phosphatidylglycerophosphatase A, partial [Planctomycetes bacterium]|nr:phosphatidylglycerophosphatase A [Planctomycetota bacterium]